MRTTQRDRSQTLTMAGSCTGAVGGGSGLFTGDGVSIPFTFTRTAAGSYRFTFDASYAIVAVVVMTDGSQPSYGRYIAQGPGTLTIATFTTHTVVGVDTSFQFIITLRKT